MSVLRESRSAVGGLLAAVFVPLPLVAFGFGAIPAGAEKELERRRLKNEAAHPVAAERSDLVEARLGNIEAMLREILDIMKDRTDAA